MRLIVPGALLAASLFAAPARAQDPFTDPFGEAPQRREGSATPAPSASPAKPKPTPKAATPAKPTPRPIISPGQKLGASVVAGVPVKGLTVAQAKARLSRRLAAKLDVRVTLSHGDVSISRRRRDLGITLDLNAMLYQASNGIRFVPLRLAAEPLRVQRALRSVAPAFDREARDARLVETAGKVTIVPERNGLKLDVAATAFSIAPQIEKNPTLTKLAAIVKAAPPSFTGGKLKGIDGILSRFRTRFDPSLIGRTTNVRRASRAIDGKILAPGEVFSLNDTVGERTARRGYKEAIIFANGKKIKGLGGGVSQVTGTLFNAALEAGLPIVGYRVHSRPVAYLPIGRDATVVWNSFDMKFKNNTGAPILIDYKTTRNRAIVTLYGKKPKAQSVEISVRSQKIGPRRINAQLFRVIKQGGKVVAKERVGTSAYRWQPDDAE